MKTKEEKLRLQERLAHYCFKKFTAAGLSYRDGVIIILSIAYTFVRFCARKGLPDGMRNSQMVAKRTRVIIEAFLDEQEGKGLAGFYTLQDDQTEEEQS